jgi:hypothetical protein
MYDVYRLAMMMLFMCYFFTGSKYLEYISSITIMHIDNINWTHRFWMKKKLANAQILEYSFKEKVAGINLGILLCTQGTYCTRPRAIILIEPIAIRRILRRYGGGGCPFFGGHESQNPLREDYQAWVHIDQMVLVIVKRESGPCEWRPTQGLHSPRKLKWELENDSRQPSNPKQ